MFRKTLITVTFAAVATVAMSIQMPGTASAAIPDCTLNPLGCGVEEAADGAGITVELDVDGGFVSDADIGAVMERPEDVADALTTPTVDVPSVPELPSATEPGPDAESDADADADAESDASDVDATDTGTSEPASGASPTTDAEPPRELEHGDEAANPVAPTTDSAVGIAHTGETAVAAADSATLVQAEQAFGPGVAGLLGALGALVLVAVVLTAFALGRRGA